MYIFIVSLICAIMLVGVRQIAYPHLIENIGVGFLLFIAIDSGLRAIIGKPSWLAKLAQGHFVGPKK